MNSTELRKYQIGEDGNVYRRGTLAQLLDTRDVAYGEPSLSNLPSTINPLKFLFSNLLKNNCCIIKIKQNGVTTDNNYMKLLSDINYVVTPYTSTLVCLELTPIIEDIPRNSYTDEVKTYSITTAADRLINSYHEQISTSYYKNYCR